MPAEYARLSNEKLQRAQKEADKRAAAVRKAAEEDQERARRNEVVIQKDAEDEQKEADREAEARSVVEASGIRPAPIHVMYVPPSDVEAFETAAVRLGAFVSYNAKARTYEISEAVTSKIQVKELVAHYAQGSRGHDRWNAAQQKQIRLDRRIVEAARTGKNMANDSEIRAASQAKLLPDNTPPKDRQSSDMRYVARARAAKDEGLQFVSAFIRRGFRLDASGTTSHEQQMKRLNEAKLEELREVAARTQMLWHAASQKGRQFFACLVLARGFEAIENRYREMTKQLLNGDSAPAPAPTKLASPSLNRRITPRSKGAQGIVD